MNIASKAPKLSTASATRLNNALPTTSVIESALESFYPG